MTQDAETNDEVARSDLVKGYEFEKDRYILLEDEDFEQARIESCSSLTINKCVDANTINPVHFDTPYYVAPDGEAGQDVFVVLRDALRKTRSAALSRIVIARRECAIALLASGKGMVCHTLHDPHDLWDAAPLWEDIADTRPDPDMVHLATQLIARQNGQFQPDDTVDRYEAKLRDVIEAKLKGEGIEPEPEDKTAPDNVIDLMAALKASLGQDSGKRPRTRSIPKSSGATKSSGAAKSSRKTPRKQAS